MAQTKVIGTSLAGSLQGGVEQAIDPTFLAARIALKPLDHAYGGALLGHYAVGQKSGNFTSFSSADVAGSLRWAPTITNTYLVLMRLKWGFVTQSTATAGVYDVECRIVRGFSVDFTTNSTAANLASVAKSNAMRANMAPSQMGTNGPRICTTAGMTGQTYTLDNAAFAVGVANLTGTTVGIATSGTLYEYTSLAQHPVVLSNQEGVSVRALTNSAGGTYNVYLQWEWCEVSVY